MKLRSKRSPLPLLSADFLGRLDLDPFRLLSLRRLWQRDSENAVLEACLDLARVHTIGQAQIAFERTVPALGDVAIFRFSSFFSPLIVNPLITFTSMFFSSIPDNSAVIS